MALTRAEVMVPPGGPGVIGAIKAGFGININEDGTISLGAAGIAAGTRMLFFSADAPVGWKRVTSSTEDRALRLMANGGGNIGGSTPFTQAFSSYTPQGNTNVVGFQVTLNTTGTQLSTGMLAPHQHKYMKLCNSGSSGIGPGPAGVLKGCDGTSTGQSGGNGPHTHPLNGTIDGGVSSFSPLASTQFQVSYVDVLLCEKE